MKNKILLRYTIFFLGIYTNNLQAQSATVTPSVINSTGTGIYLVGGNYFEISIGENIASTLTTSTGFITQGFLQPTYNSTIPIDSNGYIKIYPVPASTILTIEYKGFTVKELQVFNCLGQLVLSFTSGFNAIDVSRLPSSTYILHVITNTTTKKYFVKFIKL